MKRRTFIVASGSLLGAASLGRAATLAGGLPAASSVRMAAFSGLEGASFSATQNRRSTELRLVSVKQAASSPGIEQFSLVFSAGAPLASGLYEVEQAATGTVAMYLEAAGESPQGQLCRADFSLLA
ncbi:DUF6916 family protein [Pseudoduganella aquatica]|uniref:DUF6916 domain-containing protein n=1 Tax=Pseudoduganella aquatica TaxID=2660641 RepID=A0A7X4HHD9_9BURK|nr:hypothetical protein [Pseudoduganella aquatica]MYN10522.1 hypothetical protein [Pseudoduganella aquatica]